MCWWTGGRAVDDLIVTLIECLDGEKDVKTALKQLGGG